MAGISKIKIGNTVYDIVAGDVVSYSATLQSGTKIGTLTINSTSYDLYCQTVPTNVSDFVNDAGYITSSALDPYYTKSQVDALISDFGGFEVVATLPTQDIKTNIIYLLGPIGTGSDKYEEWIYSNNTWVKIGDTSVDLSNYYNKTEIDNKFNSIDFPEVDLSEYYTKEEVNSKIDSIDFPEFNLDWQDD